jgi:uncharacterized protein (TIGR03000 family)
MTRTTRLCLAGIASSFLLLCGPVCVSRGGGPKGPAPKPTEAEKLRADLAKAQAALKDLQGQLARSRQELARVQGELGAQRAAAAAGKQALARSQAEAGQARRERDAARAQLQQTQARLRQVEADVGRDRQRLAASQKELAGVRGRWRAAESRVKAFGKQLAAARKSLAAEHKRTAAEAKALQASAAELDQTRSRLTSAESALAAARKDLEASRVRLSNVDFPRPLGGRARFLVELPDPDARLYIDGRLFAPGRGKLVRQFTTVKLRPGKRYVLDLRAETVREGRTVAVSRQITFEPDTEHRLYLGPAPAADQAAGPASDKR